MKVGAMKTTFFSALIFSLVTFSMMMCGELVVRLLYGYALMSQKLIRTLTFECKQFLALDDYSTVQFLLKEFSIRNHLPVR